MSSYKPTVIKIRELLMDALVVVVIFGAALGAVLFF